MSDPHVTQGDGCKRITIPVDVCQELGIEAGEQPEWVTEETERGREVTMIFPDE